MKAELILKSASETETFPLTGDRATVGRSINAHVRLSDKLVSREHCEVLRLGNRHVVRDLASANGTFVNGKNVTEKVLEWGDKILVGESTLVFLFDEKGGRSETDLQVTDHDPAESQSMFLRKSDLNVDGAAKEECASHYLDLLYRAGDAILDQETIGEVCHALLEVLRQQRRFGRVAVLLFDSRGKVSERFSRVEGDPSRAPIRLDAGLLLKVFREGDSVFTRGRKIDDMTCSCMLAPVRGRERVHGALYIDDLASREELDEKELHLVSAIGHIVGLAFDRVIRFEELQGDVAQYRRMIAAEMDLVGESEVMRGIVDQVRQGAMAKGPMLITGERGTGRDLVARLLHFHGERSGRPFETVELGAIPPEQVFPELFGREKRTSETVSDHPGRIEIAREGTIFIDGVEKLSPDLQEALIRVMESGILRRVGGTRDVSVSARIVVGTTDALRSRRFSCPRIDLPPLRERPGDIRVLSRHFGYRFAREMGKPFAGFSRGAEERLRDHEWPGNVRDLRNLVERVVSEASSPEIGESDLRPWLPPRS